MKPYTSLLDIARFEKAEARGYVLQQIGYIKDLEKRRQGKPLKVFGFPQDGSYVPAIRVAGKWLEHFGFHYDDVVILKAQENEITIRKVEGR